MKKAILKLSRLPGRKLIALSSGLALVSLPICSPWVAAQAIITKPKGVIVAEVQAGTGAERSLALLSLPLITPPHALDGLSKGTIGAIQGTNLNVADAGWTPEELSQPGTPLALLVTTGGAQGRVLRILSNTGDSMVLETSGPDLASLGIMAGVDEFQIIALDTLASLLGTPETTGVKGGATQGSADLVQMTDQLGNWKVYYYKTDAQPPGWVLATDHSPADDVIIRPDAAFFFARMAPTPLSILITGEVPPVGQSRIDLPHVPHYLLGSIWPVRSSLDELGLQTLPGWVSHTNPSQADQIQILTEGRFWQVFFHDGTAWRRVAPNRLSTEKVIPAGSGLLIRRAQPGSTINTLTSSAPYPLP